MYTVGRLAKRFGLSRSTLLYYNKIGLLRPSFHAPGEYRNYSEEDAERLRRICLFRDAGLSLEAIARALDALAARHAARSIAPQSLTGILENRLEELQREILILQSQQTLITGLLGMDSLPEALPMTKDVWTRLLTHAGFSEDDMLQWHAQFEHCAPQRHAQFLRTLGIPHKEANSIRSRCAAMPLQ